MRILFLSHKFWPSVGGIQNLSLNLAKHLVARNHEVVVYTSLSEEGSAESELVGGVQVYRFPKLNLPFSRPWYITPGMTTKFRRVRSDYDILHSFSFISYQSLLGALVKAKTGIPFVLNPAFHPYDGFYERSIGKQVIRAADTVVAQSQKEQDGLARLVQGEQICKVPPGIDSSSFKGRRSPSTFRSAHDIGVDDKVLLYVGYLSAPKAIPQLIGIMPYILKRIPNSRLILVGHTSAENYLRDLVASNGTSRSVLMLTNASDEVLQDAYSAADVFVFPSKQESFGMSLLEAAGAGVPIVSTDVGAAGEIIRDGSTGFVCSQCDLNFAEKVVTILSEGSFSDFAKEWRAIILKNFDWKRITIRIETVYQHLLN